MKTICVLFLCILQGQGIKLGSVRKSVFIPKSHLHGKNHKHPLTPIVKNQQLKHSKEVSNLEFHCL